MSSTHAPAVVRTLAELGEAVGVAPGSVPETLYTGIDLGTATCVICVVGPDGDPLWADFVHTSAIRDGVVVDFAAAAAATTELRQRAQAALGVELLSAATAYPPCVGEAESRACRFVLEAAGFADVRLIDEVSAANLALGVSDGVVVDVGGGSTGVGVFRDGELVALDDRPGGGHHLDLILSGALGISTAEAEQRKREATDDEFLPILRPGFERIARNIADLTVGADELDVHLAGGALMYPGADITIGNYLQRTVRTYPSANLITPLGIAHHAR